MTSWLLLPRRIWIPPATGRSLLWLFSMCIKHLYKMAKTSPAALSSCQLNPWLYYYPPAPMRQQTNLELATCDGFGLQKGKMGEIAKTHQQRRLCVILFGGGRGLLLLPRQLRREEGRGEEHPGGERRRVELELLRLGGAAAAAAPGRRGRGRRRGGPEGSAVLGDDDHAALGGAPRGLAEDVGEVNAGLDLSK